jgi:hypothetical protein
MFQQAETDSTMMDDDIMDRVVLPEVSVSRLRRRAWPLLVAIAFVVVGTEYSLFWASVVRHQPSWLFSGDIWATYRSAHYVAWGDLGGIYGAGAGLVTFPGVLLAFAPVAMLTGSLGLTEAFPKFVPYPSAWLVLGPYEMLLSTVSLFACDALAERLGVGRGRRRCLCVVQACVLWNVSVVWGHPEDAIAVGLALYALVFALDGRWTGAGWLFGAAMATQPLVLLMFPVLLALGGRRHVTGLVVRGAGPAVALIVTPLVSQFHATTHALLDQPNYPGIDHTTPWTSLAPVLAGRGHSLTVAAGPGRVVALVLACGLGWWARRWRHDPDLIVWAAGTALALRCLTESVMVGFYVWPSLAVGLVVAGHLGRWRLGLASIAALLTTAVTQSHLSWLPWWAAVTAGIVMVIAVGTPVRRRTIMDDAIDLPTAGRRREVTPVLVGALR